MDDGDNRPLAGARAWIISRDRAGNLTQANGLAGALGLASEIKLVAPKGFAGLIAPYGSPAWSEPFGRPGTAFAPPWPEVAIGIGRTAVPYLRAVKRAGGRSTFAIMLMDPHVAHSAFDLVWVPAHDRYRGGNAVVTPTVMHGFSPARLASLRAQLAPSILDLPQPRVAVVLGGRNKAYRYGPADHERLAAALGAVAAGGASFLVTPSRRTHADLLAAALAATAGRPRLIQTGAGENLYPQFLAAADRLIVTGDSVSMTSEALATGRPVDVFVPEGRGGKFARFHQAVFSAGLARPLDTLSQSDADWTPRAVDATETVARHVERQWLLARLPQPHG